MKCRGVPANSLAQDGNEVLAHIVLSGVNWYSLDSTVSTLNLSKDSAREANDPVLLTAMSRQATLEIELLKR